MIGTSRVRVTKGPHQFPKGGHNPIPDVGTCAGQNVRSSSARIRYRMSRGPKQVISKGCQGYPRT